MPCSQFRVLVYVSGFYKMRTRNKYSCRFCDLVTGFVDGWKYTKQALAYTKRNYVYGVCLQTYT